MKRQTLLPVDSSGTKQKVGQYILAYAVGQACWGSIPHVGSRNSGQLYVLN